MYWYQITGILLMLIGSFFLFLGALGILRMPDVYNRLQAGTKASTMGAISLILGTGIYHPEWLLKTGLIVFFLLLTNPVSSSVISRASHRSDVELTKISVHDAYEEDVLSEEKGKKKKVKNG
ncbi:MAG: monovalent cation/H(+) antiporter subunit G [Acidobacteriota bacterium]